MRLQLLMVPVICLACNASSDRKSEEEAITKLLNEETHFAAKGDTANWASCWVKPDDAGFILTNAEGTQAFDNLHTVAKELSQYKPIELKLSRSNYDFIIDDEVAFVSFDQQDNWGGADRKTKETRALKKINGEWKIAHASVVEISSFANKETASFHMAVSKIPKNPKSGFTNLYGLGGMSAGYVEAPANFDFAPLLEGLPENMCIAPHWGYIIDGSVRIKYPGGKEETIHAGEVFYWPPPHTGFVVENVKFIDFSPDSKFVPLMDHIAKKIAQLQAKK